MSLPSALLEELVAIANGDKRASDCTPPLLDKGFVKQGALTQAAYDELAPYKVENAVIMAAGLSSRFAPISYEKPKGLLTVRGEILIERQIHQLQEAGIADIAVVVGYKKEFFFYLEQKFGVRIVVNREFATRNNNSTLMAVRELLGNTYVCSSDDYFTQNPFRPYAAHAHYASVHEPGKTPEWCMECDAQDRITSVSIGGEDAWIMLGHVYFDRAFSSAFRSFLEAEYDLPETADKLWEDIYIEHLSELDMRLMRYDRDAIHEFDSLDELRDFDPTFLDNVDSEILENIASTLRCEKRDICDVYPLKQGLTNLSCHFRVRDGEYVYRHPGVGTEELIDRKGEYAAQVLASKLGLDRTFIFQDPEKGWKISRFIPNCRPLDPKNPAHVERAMRMARSFHEQDASIERRFSFADEGAHYESLLLKKGPIEIPGYREMAARFSRLAAFVAADEAPVCLCHNDFFHLNFLLDEHDGLSLIDWEYAGMSDYANDFGTFVVCGELTREEAEAALASYFGRTPTDPERRHNLAMVALAGWCWYLWALVKEAEGDSVGEWLYIYYRYAREYIDAALDMYE